MLHLPQVTLISIDTFKPQRTADVMAQSMKWVKFAEAKLLTDQPVPKPPPGLQIVRHSHDDKHFQNIPGSHATTLGYEWSILTELHKHVRTSHLLLQEWDSAVLNPDAWDDGWLKYSYIGAPWCDHHDSGWPPCTEANNVGNGGFSLRSRKFCELVSDAAYEHKNDPGLASSDRWICRSIRPWLEREGMRFAPESIARRFSAENVVYTGQFGFHGRQTAALNGWGAWLAHVRP